MFWYALLYILFTHLLVNYQDKAIFLYYYYFKITNDSFFSYLKKLILSHSSIYIGTIIKELCFRGPLLFTDNAALYWVLLILFSLIHYESKQSTRSKVKRLVHIFILGYFFSEMGLKYSLPCHLFNNFLVTVRNFIIDFRRHYLGLILRCVESENGNS